MSGIIHFTSGKTLDITEAEFRNISPKLNGKGIKTQRLASGHIIPMNSMTMEFIEMIPEVEEGQQFDLGNGVVVGEVIQPMMHGEEAILEPMSEHSEPMTLPPKTADEIMADMTAKSNCKHEPTKLELYRQNTAKGIRYFPVCSFCGKRERYVSERKIVEGEYVGTPNEKWTSDDVANAIQWIED